VKAKTAERAALWAGRGLRLLRTVVTCVRCSILQPNIRPANTHQFASAQSFDQLEGLALARA